MPRKKTTAKRTTKKKSTVNKAGNYTKPTMRKRLFEKIKAGSRGGKPGQWSARKAQLLAKEYKSKAGGGYKVVKKTQKSELVKSQKVVVDVYILTRIQKIPLVLSLQLQPMQEQR